MKGFLTAALLLLAAAANAERPTEKCEDEAASCKETCTLEYGTTSTTKGRYQSCNAQCDSRLRSCVVMVANEDAKKPKKSAPAKKEEPVTPTDAEETSP